MFINHRLALFSRQDNRIDGIREGWELIS